MNSLKDLNGFSNTAIVYQTANTANVVISTPVNQTLVMPDYTNKFEWPVGMEVLQTGNVGNVNYYTISMPVNPGLANVAQAVTWPNLPNTFTITRQGYIGNTNTYDYQVKGPITTTNWNLIKSPVIQLGNLYNYGNTVMSANVYINAGNTATHTLTLHFPFDVPILGGPLTYQEDVLTDLDSFGVSPYADQTKVYQVSIEQDPVVGNLIIGNTYYGGELVLTGNANSINNSLANLQFLGNANSFANTTLYYSQKQVTNGIQQAWDYPVTLNSTGDFFDAPISGGFRLLDSSGNYTSTANVTSTDFYYNKFVYFEAVGNGKSGTGNTVSNVTVNFTNPVGWDEIYTIGNVVTITPNAFSTGLRYQNYYALTGFTNPGPSVSEQTWTAVVSATTTGSQVSTRTFTARKFADAAAVDSTQTDYVLNSGTYKQGRQGPNLWTVDLPYTLANSRFTLTSNSNVEISTRHYPDFGYQNKTLIAGPVLTISRDDESQNLNYNLATGTFSPSLNANNQAFWERISLNITLGNVTILSKANGTSSVTTVNQVANITANCSATEWNTPQVVNIPLSQTVGNVSGQYFTIPDNNWISITIPITPTSVSTNLQFGPNYAPVYGNATAKNFLSAWSRI